MPCNKSRCTPCAAALLPRQLLLLLLLLQLCRRRRPHVLRMCMVCLSVLLQRRLPSAAPLLLLWLGGCGGAVASRHARHSVMLHFILTG